MNLLEEYKKRLKAIDERLEIKEPRKIEPRPIEAIPQCQYNLVVKDMLGHSIKILGFSLTYKECLTLGKHCEKSKLIKESEGQYTLHYTKIERG